MRSIKLIVLLISALTFSISGCKKDKTPPPSGGGGGGGSSSDCCICDIGGLDLPFCEDDYTSSEWNQIMEDYDCDCSSNSAGFICSSGSCDGVTSGADYNSYGACVDDCGDDTSGYNCVSGNCQSVSSGAQYSTLSQCQAVCGGSSSDCCDCTGIGFVCDECCDGEFDMLGESWATWLSIFESSGCNCD